MFELKKIITCVSLCMVLSGCAQQEINEVTEMEELAPTVTFVGETQPIEYVGTETYAPIMPEDNYTMSGVYDEIVEETSTSVVQAEQNSVGISTELPEATVITTVPTTTIIEFEQSNTQTTVVFDNIDISKLPTISERIAVDTVAHRYFFEKLTEKEQKVYQAILETALAFGAVVNFDTPVTEAEYERIFGLVFIQNPEIYWLRGGVDLADDGKSANLYYLCTQAQTASMDVFLAEKVKQLMSTIPADASDLKKLQYCHNYICTNTAFLEGGTTTSNVIGPLVDGVGQCLGYAKAFLYLCNLVDVPCLIVTGTNDVDASHAWNVVQLDDGEWYNVDCTWDDPILKVADPKNVSYMYFCVPDMTIHNKTHYNVNKPDLVSDWVYFTPPVCTEYDKNIDMCYGNYAYTYEEGYEILRVAMLDAVKTGNTVVHVKYAEQSVYLDAIERLKVNKEILNLKNEINTALGYNKIQSVSANRENALNYFEVYLKY